MESLLLSCRAFASPTLCRFIPAHLCPRHSPASFIGGFSGTDERKPIEILRCNHPGAQRAAPPESGGEFLRTAK
jgi:hypothetical protein